MEKRLDEAQREAIALKRFSLLGPVLNGQVTNQEAYFREASGKVIEMPYLGRRRYSAKTMKHWLEAYRKENLSGLRPGYRSDRGKSRVVDAATAERIVAERRTYPRRPATVLYETMAAEKRLDVSKVSMSTFYRCLKNAPVVEVPAMDGDRQLRFAYDRVNELWQGDVMYGPYVKDGRVKRQTYLIDFIDDASRLVVYGRFYWSQRYEELRDAFKEGVLRRGRPSRVFVDNGKIFHTQQFETVCATLGTTLIHSEPYVPNTRGKVERIHRTIRDRFLSVLDPTTLTGLDDLNARFSQWLDTDYQRKVHSSTGRSPLEYFLSQADSVRLVEDPARLEEAFLLRAKRTVGRDATLHMESLLYETDPRLAGQRVEARYDPAWLEPPHAPLQLYVDNRKVGEAHWVRFQDNAVTRRGRGARAGVELPAPNGRPTMPAGPTPVPEPMIRFTDAMGGDEPCSPSTSD